MPSLYVVPQQHILPLTPNPLHEILDFTASHQKLGVLCQAHYPGSADLFQNVPASLELLQPMALGAVVLKWVYVLCELQDVELVPVRFVICRHDACALCRSCTYEVTNIFATEIPDHRKKGSTINSIQGCSWD